MTKSAFQASSLLAVLISVQRVPRMRGGAELALHPTMRAESKKYFAIPKRLGCLHLIHGSEKRSARVADFSPLSRTGVTRASVCGHPTGRTLQ